MTALGAYLQADHRYCDSLFELIEPLAAEGQWPKVEQAYDAFEAAVEQHLDREEAVLFPALEAAGAGALGPTKMMRAEHEGMRDLLTQLGDAVRCRAVGEVAAVIDTLRIMLQQHNMKEENVLYPMADRVLADRSGELMQLMERRRPFVRAR